jgi:hypothetical protein
MTPYRITSRTSGPDLGIYYARSEADALDVLARDAGYQDFATACAVTGDDGADLRVEEHQAAPRDAGVSS